MGAPVVAVLVTALGAAVGSYAARWLSPGAVRARGSQQRLAQVAVTLLGAVAGAQIALQVYDLVHRLQLNAGLDGGFGGRFLHGENLLDVALAIRGILFYGVLLIGLTTAVSLLADRLSDRAPA